MNKNGRMLASIIVISLTINALPVSSKPISELSSLQAINRSLKSAPLDPRLNFLAALSYERGSVVGTERREMARVGYKMALKADPSFWPAHVQLGLLAMEDRNAEIAREHFLSAAMLQPVEPTIYYSLARAAYCAGDLVLAKEAWEKATALRAPQTSQEFVTGAAVLTVSGSPELARQMIERIEATGALVPAMVWTEASLDAATDKLATDVPTEEEQNSSNTKMGMVDVIILRRDEGSAQSTGINILDALNLQFGSTLVNSTWASSRDRLSNTQTSSTIDRSGELMVSVPSVNYSLNIANSLGSQSTIQAQQALLIYDKQTSKVQIGRILTFAVEGSFESAVSKQEDGLEIQIGADFSEAKTVKLDITASLQKFLPGSGPGSFRQAVLTDKTATTVTASLRFGETILITSGGTASNSRGFSKTPVLGSLPLLGNLFNSRDISQTDVSTLILLTLRQQGSHELPMKTAAERQQFEEMRRRLLDNLGTSDDATDTSRFAPDQQAMSFRLDNPAREGNTAYLKRISALTI